MQGAARLDGNKLHIIKPIYKSVRNLLLSLVFMKVVEKLG